MGEFVGYPLVVTDRLEDGGAEELLGESRVEPDVRSQLSQTADLPLLALGIRGRYRVHGLEPADLLRTAETLDGNVDGGGIEVINRSAMFLQESTRLVT